MRMPLTVVRYLYLAAAMFFVFDVTEYRAMHVHAQTTQPTTPVTNPAYVPDLPPQANIQVFWANEHMACTVPNPQFKVGEQHTATFTAAMPGQVGAASPLTFAVYLRHINGTHATPDSLIIPYPLDPKAPCPTIAWK